MRRNMKKKTHRIIIKLKYNNSIMKKCDIQSILYTLIPQWNNNKVEMKT